MINSMQLYELPDELKRKILLYIPNMSKTASLISKAIEDKVLQLKYIRMIPHTPSQHKYLNFVGDVYLITRHLKELRPTVLRQDTYGDGVLQRINISVGERVRLRRITQITG